MSKELTKLPNTIWILAAGLLCVGAGQSVIFITIPPLARDLGLTEIQIGSIFATSAFFYNVTHTQSMSVKITHWIMLPDIVWSTISRNVTGNLNVKATGLKVSQATPMALLGLGWSPGMKCRILKYWIFGSR